MFKNVKQRAAKFAKNNAGFTMLELIVVIAIMGFLIAMVAPRFAGIVDSAVDPICDSNQQRLVGVVGTYTEQNNSIPDTLTNLVPNNAVAGALTATAVPTPASNGFIWDLNKEHANYFNPDFASRNGFYVHTLNAAEATELQELGLSSLINVDGAAQTVASGVRVFMVGAGAATDAADITVDGLTAELGEADHLLRIVMGVGPESELVSDGLITAAGCCPGGVVLEDNVTYNNYNLVLPRLQATIDRVDGYDPADIAADNISISAQPLDEDGNNVGDPIVVDAAEAQEAWSVATLCPEGHQWPAGLGESYDIIVAIN